MSGNLLIIVLALYTSIPLHGQGFVTSFIAEPRELRGGSAITLTGGFGVGQHRYPLSGTMSGQLDYDRSDGVTFRRISVHIKPILLNLDFSDFRDGIPRGRRIEGTITFDPIEFLDDEDLRLLFSRQGRPGVVPNFKRNLGSSEQMRISGSYKFRGNDLHEEVSGTFSVLPEWSRQGIPTLDPTYSSHWVTLMGFGDTSWQTTSELTLFSTTIDRRHTISISLDGAIFHFPEQFRFFRYVSSVITGIRFEGDSIVISGTGTIGISDSAAGPFSGSIALPAIIQPESSAKFFKAN